MNAQELIHPMYRKDIDGMRAIAVLSVVIYHAFPVVISGGFIGVDIFFVISGFLISNIIIGSLERGAFIFSDFYARRVRRIFPSLIFVMVFCFLFGWFSLLASEYKQLGYHIQYGSMFVSNFALWRESGYFDNAAELKILLHLWSLAIEEQFYIVWPLLVWMMWKGKYNLLSVILLIIVISFSLSVQKMNNDVVAAFYSPQTRFWELLAGSLLAHRSIYKWNLFPEKIINKMDYFFGVLIYSTPIKNDGQVLRNLQSLLGISLVVFGLFATKKENFPGVWALLPVIGSMLVIGAGSSAWFNRSVLSNRILVWFGLISFPLYLWHWVLLSFLRIMENGAPTVYFRIGAVIISIVLAWLTFLFIEKPLRFSFNRKITTIFLFISMIVIAVVGWYTDKRDGFGFRHEQLEQNSRQFSWEPEMNASLDCIQKYGQGYCLINDINREPDVMLMGDSHGNSFYHGIAKELASKSINVLNRGGAGCLPFFNVADYSRGTKDECMNLVNQSLNLAIANASIKEVILIARWALAFTGKGYDMSYESDDRVISLISQPDIKDFKQVFKISMKETIDRLHKANKKIVLVLDNPELGFNVKTCVETRPLSFSRKINTSCGVSRKDFDNRTKEYKEVIASVLKDYPSIQVFDPSDYLCDSQWCSAIKDNKMFYRDDDHLSLQGSEFMAHKLLPMIGL